MHDIVVILLSYCTVSWILSTITCMNSCSESRLSPSLRPPPPPTSVPYHDIVVILLSYCTIFSLDNINEQGPEFAKILTLASPLVQANVRPLRAPT